MAQRPLVGGQEDQARNLDDREMGDTDQRSAGQNLETIRGAQKIFLCAVE